MRIATEKDLADIVAIYNSTVATRQSTADTQEITVESRLEWFRQHKPDKYPLLVHEVSGQVVAWVSFQAFYGRPAYNRCAELSIYIAPDFRGKGLGRLLAEEALAMTGKLDIINVVCFIFAHNLPSIRLFQSLGFQEWGKLPEIAEMDGNRYSLCILGKKMDM